MPSPSWSRGPRPSLPFLNVRNHGLQNAMTSSEERTSADAEGYSVPHREGADGFLVAKGNFRPAYEYAMNARTMVLCTMVLQVVVERECRITTSIRQGQHAISVYAAREPPALDICLGLLGEGGGVQC